ncbi:hypothetical protein [Micromonospora ureilytica]
MTNPQGDSRFTKHSTVLRAVVGGVVSGITRTIVERLIRVWTDD